MTYDIIETAKTRRTAKAYDPDRKISPQDIERIKDLLRYSPSSTNSQPWYFVLATTGAGKERMTKGTEKFPFNTPNILNASACVVFASRLELPEEHLQRVTDQEDADGRFATDPSFKDRAHAARRLFANIHKQDMKDVQHWMDKQVYLNMGQFLLGVAAMNIDATPMEGVDIPALDAEFGLRDLGYSALAIVSLGYHHTENDFNAKLPKSRLPMDTILTEV